MANKTTEELPDATEPLAGTELVAGVQGGNSRKLSVNAIRGAKLKSLVDLATAAGDLIYGLGTGMLARLAKGSAGQVLQMNAGATAPEWVDAGYKCRAWVNFNGTGTVSIRGAGNVASITDNGTGDYTINFATPMPDTNYTVTGRADLSVGVPGNGYDRAIHMVTAGTSSCRINTVSASSLQDCEHVHLVFHR